MLSILLRHGIAVPLEEYSGEDFDRPLTPEGRKRTHEAVLGLSSLALRPEQVISSPKLRAVQTAQLVRDALGKGAPPLTQWPELMHDDFVPVLSRLRHLADQGTQAVVCVGHEPNLSRFAVQLLTGYADAFHLELRKAGAIALDVTFEPLNATLMWHLTPKQLRRLRAK